MKRYSISLAVTEMQTETMRCHFSNIRSIKKNRVIITSAGDNTENLTLSRIAETNYDQL